MLTFTFYRFSLGLTGIDLYQSKNLDDALGAIDQFVKTNPQKRWLTDMGWQYNIFDIGMRDKKALEQLDAISNGHPIYLDAYDGHSIWVNSVVTKMAGINSTTSFTGFGEIIKDANGEPTGALTEGARSLVSAVVPVPATAEKLNALRAGMRMQNLTVLPAYKMQVSTLERLVYTKRYLKMGS